MLPNPNNIRDTLTGTPNATSVAVALERVQVFAFVFSDLNLVGELGLDIVKVQAQIHLRCERRCAALAFTAADAQLQLVPSVLRDRQRERQREREVASDTDVRT